MPRWSEAEEAILLASPTDEVCRYLKKRAAKPSYFDPISKEVEMSLLERHDRLLDLTMSEHCLHPETARLLFNRDPEDWPIRSLVLSNEVMAHGHLLVSFPTCLFDDDEGLLRYLSTVAGKERGTMFSNASLGVNFLEEFLSMGKHWQAMQEDQRLWALDNLGSNERMRRKRSTADHEDGWDWYIAGKPFEAAWRLIERLDVSTDAATHLAALLEHLPNDCLETDGMLLALDRWKPLSSDETAREVEHNQKGQLSAFQQVRQAGARLLASDYKFDQKQFRESDDLALRCGAYEVGPSTAEEVSQAIERDGDLARLYLLRNERSWRTSASRNELLDLLTGAENDHIRWEYRDCERSYREKFPLWFKDEDLPVEPDERPLSEATIADLVTGVASDPNRKQMLDRINSLEKQQQTLIWLVGAVLLAVLYFR